MGNKSHLANRRRDSNPGRLKDLAADAPTFAANGQTLTRFLNGNLLQRFKILLDICPFEPVACLIQAAIQFFAQHQSQETAEDMASNRLIHLVVDGPGFQDRLHIPENLLHLPELFVLESYGFGRQIPICPQHPFAIKTGIFIDLFLIDNDMIPVDFQVLAVPAVPNEAFGISLQLLLKGLDNVLTILLILPGLSRIQADNAWPPIPTGRRRPP